MSIILKYILILVFLLSQLIGYSQQYYFARYSSNDGLPHSRVNDLMQGKEGYLWLATNMGFSKFDGHKFQNYSFKDGFADNKVTCVLELDTALFLLGHENGELSYFNLNGSVNKLQLEKGVNRIFNLFKDSQNNIWISTQGRGAFKISANNLLDNFEKKNYLHFHEENGLARDVTSIIEDSQNNFWFLTDLGIKRKLKEKDSFDFFLPKGIDFLQFSCIEKDVQNRIWLGTVTSGIFRIDENLQNLKHFSLENGDLKSNFVSCIKSDENQTMVGTWGGGFTLISNDDQCETISEINGLSENKVRCLEKDIEGNIWIGSNQNGLSCYRGKEFQQYLKSKDGTNTPIGAILQDKAGNYWMGSNNGMYFMPKGSQTSKRIDFLTGGDDIEVTSLCQDKRGNIWVGTWGAGILIVNPNSFSISRFNGKLMPKKQGTFTEQYVHTIRQTTDNKIWISMLRGVSVYNPLYDNIRTYTTRDGLSENNTTDIEEDTAGNIWIGSAGTGITIYKNGEFMPLESIEEAIYPAISSITKDENGIIWFSTEGGGIYSYIKGQIERYTVIDGISSNYVSLLESDKNGKLWLGTNKGICAWSPKDKTNRIYDRTDRIERIEAKSNSVLRDKNNNIWVGTINGVIQFDPSSFKINTTESITHLNTITVFKDTLTTDNVILNYKDNYLTFYFNGICFSDPTKVRYKYRLDGFDDRWIETPLNFVAFNNLGPADYIFEVKSCNNDGIWNKESVKFKFKITPPYWMTWWFYAIIITAIVLLIFLFIKFRERNLKLEKKHLEQLVSERTREITNQKQEIEQQRDELKEYSNIIEYKNMAITDSIRYAKRIQLATLPYSELIEKSLPKSFVLYKPKDIVSGDFYAFGKKDNKILMAVADCTGHGVPGAFMSMIGTNLFSQIINEKGITKPSEILNELNTGIERALKQDETENHDGMDVIVVLLDFENNQFEMAGANRPLWIVSKDEIKEKSSSYDYFGERMKIIRPDKQPIGGLIQGSHYKFSNNDFEFNKGDTLYLTTDGYVDQFGGAKGKKLLSKRLRNKILEISHLEPHLQKIELDNYFERWRGELEQVDDVLIVGIQFHL